MDEILHHFETMGHHCLFTGESSLQPQTPGTFRGDLATGANVESTHGVVPSARKKGRLGSSLATVSPNAQ